MKVFLVYDGYGATYHSDNPRMEDIEKIFIGDDMEEECKKYCHEKNKKCGGGIDFEEVNADVVMHLIRS